VLVEGTSAGRRHARNTVARPEASPLDRLA